ncbi:putative nitroreductase [Chloropicon roscoffensis]|uniref:Nitroreductase n=1 Tax=Chloropicon roscoffensis TaxID=1461544 RepID=A0AAX4PI64_9CHLO
MLILAIVSAAATNEVAGLTNTYNQVSPWLVYLACTILISTTVASLALWSGKARSATVARSSAPPSSHDPAGRASLVRALVERRSVFPRDYARGHGREVPREVVDSMLEAACWAPFHGSKPPCSSCLASKACVACRSSHFGTTTRRRTGGPLEGGPTRRRTRAGAR